MNHLMKLKSIPFDLIKGGEKTIEVRLYDEKRQSIKVGDTITFTKVSETEETLTTIVEAILIYSNFKDLFSDFEPKCFGAEGWSVAEQVENMHQYYTIEEEKQFGVVGIKIRVIE